MKLFCIPHAGASSLVYEKWKKRCHSMEIIPVELAGKGRRLREKPYTTIQEGAKDIFNIILSETQVDKHYAILGHSMGGIFAYEVAKLINLHEFNPPEFIFLSGIESPDILKNNPKISLLSDKKFWHEIYNLGGLDQFILENNKLINFYLPIIKHDYYILDIYEDNQMQLPYKGILFIGNKDHVNKRKVELWQNRFVDKIKIYEFEGNHFFIYERYEEILDIISRILCMEG